MNRKKVILLSIVIVLASALASVAGLSLLRRATLPQVDKVSSLDELLAVGAKSMKESLIDYDDTSQKNSGEVSLITTTHNVDIPMVVVKSQHHVTFQGKSLQVAAVDSKSLMDALANAFQPHGLAYKPSTIVGQQLNLFVGDSYQCKLEAIVGSETVPPRYSLACIDTRAVADEYDRIRDILATSPASITAALQRQGVTLVSRTQVDHSSVSGALITVTLARPDQKWQANSLLFGKLGGAWEFVADTTGTTTEGYPAEVTAQVTDKKWNGTLEMLMQERMK